MITTRVGPKPADFNDVRKTNLAIVLRYVRANAPCSRADIAAATGLNKATVSSLVTELITRRLLRETGLAEKRIGRPATLLVVDGTAYAAIGLSLEIDRLALVATDLAGHRVICWQRAFDGQRVDPDLAVSAIADVTKRALTRLTAERRKVLGLVVAIPGSVGPSGDLVIASALGWTDVDLAGPIRGALRRPTLAVCIENNANVAALAEYRYGSQPPVANLVYLSGGPGVSDSGITAGIIAEGRLVRGGQGYAGEIGHLVTDLRGPVCSCGRSGCVAAMAAPAAIVRRVLPHAPSTVELPEAVSEIAGRAQSGDPAALAALDLAGQAIGQVAAAFVNMINPQLIALGGHFKTLSRWLLPAAQSELARLCAGPAAGGCRIVPSVLDHTAAAVGAAAKALESIDTGHLPPWDKE